MPMPRDSKPLIVGECNPYGGTDEFALYPAPDGCSGHRLCCLIFGMRRTHYLRVFDRTNLCQGLWSNTYAIALASKIQEDPQGRAILLGKKVANSFGLVFRPFEMRKSSGEFSWLLLPHPSGRNPAWEREGAVGRARECVSEFVPEIAGLVGVE